ncbi:hypothetical protein MASR2M70_02630 [Bacillota bacterium]
MKRCNRMERKRINKTANRIRCLSVLIIVLLLTSVFIPSYAAIKANTPKEEVVYINLNHDGSVDGIYVVNSFELSEDGKIIDYGDYTAFRKLTSGENMVMEDEVITIDAKAGKLYYEGKLGDNSIPWVFDIRYFIDGKEYQGREMAGKSGALEIKMKSGENKASGSSFFKSFTLQATFSMDSSICKNIRAEGATIANAGNNKQIVFTILPGKEADFCINADVKDFEMVGIGINGIPMNMDFDFENDSEMTKQLNDLRDGIVKLDDGARELRDGTKELADGTKDLLDGVKELNDGVIDLADGTKELADGTKEFVDGAVELDEGVEDLLKGTKDLKSGTKELDDGVFDLVSGAKRLHNGASNLSGGLSQLAGQNNAIMGGAGQIFDYMIEAAGAQLKASDPGIPDLTRENFKDILKGLMDQIGGLALQAAISAAETDIRNGVTEAIKQEFRDLGMSEADIDLMILDPGVQAQIEASTAAQLDIQMDGIIQSVEAALLLNPGYADLAALRGQLLGFESFYNGLSDYTAGVSATAAGAADLASGLGSLRNGVRELKDGTKELKEGAIKLNDGVIELKDGTVKLLDGSIELNDGAIELNDGVIKLKDGVIELLDGAVELHDGTVELHDGTVTMAKGTFEFRDKTAGVEKNLKDTIKDKIDEMLGKNIKLISFVSEKNTNIEAVQFIMQTEGIKLAEIVEIQGEEKEPSFWQRLSALFGNLINSEN